jgi:hypothetical protein
VTAWDPAARLRSTDTIDLLRAIGPGLESLPGAAEYLAAIEARARRPLDQIERADFLWGVIMSKWRRDR